MENWRKLSFHFHLICSTGCWKHLHSFSIIISTVGTGTRHPPQPLAPGWRIHLWRGGQATHLHAVVLRCGNHLPFRGVVRVLLYRDLLTTSCNNRMLKDILYTVSWLCLKSKAYRKFPKYSDTQNICCNHSKIWTMWLYHRVTRPNDADGMANSVDPDRSSLIWVCTVCPGISVQKLRIITEPIFHKMQDLAISVSKASRHSNLHEATKHGHDCKAIKLTHILENKVLLFSCQCFLLIPLHHGRALLMWMLIEPCQEKTSLCGFATR